MSGKTNLVGRSISEIQSLLKNKDVSATEIVKAHYDHIESVEKEVRAFNHLTKELAMTQAKRIDEMLRAKEALPPLAGVPVAIKDNMCVAGYPTACGSKILENYVPTFQSTAVEALFDAGALCIGKSNLDEFAMGSSTENSAFEPSRNPWNTKYVPGGSSGGSAAAVAAGFTTIALGSDTGGSVRQPASFCGIVGMKPTYGLVSRFGLVAFASSLDQIGPFARSVADVAITLAAIAVHDPKDSTSLPDPTDGGKNDLWALTKQLNDKCDLSKMKIGIIEELSGEGNEAEVRQAISNAADVFTKLGAKVDPVKVPRAKNALPVYYILATAEASANLARYDGVKYGYRTKDSKDLLTMYFNSRQSGFGAEVKRRIMLGTYVLSSGYYDAYYKKAQQVRQLLSEDFRKIFQNYDFVICPTSPSVAFQFGDKTGDPLTMYLSDVASIPVNLAGLPGISIPCGFGKGNMPIGLQLIGPPLSDAPLLRAAHAFEQSTDFHLKHPSLLAQAKMS
jgi:aspartyl-tRNA(Asn)/glutamyl-tRNA(Gln) amidotransferase subunit A